MLGSEGFRECLRRIPKNNRGKARCFRGIRRIRNSLGILAVEGLFNALRKSYDSPKLIQIKQFGVYNEDIIFVTYLGFVFSRKLF